MSETMTFTQQHTYTRYTCNRCQVEVLLNARQDASLRESGNSFYCLNGHSLSFGKGEAARLRERLHEKTLEFERAERQRREAEAKATALASDMKQGKCPCCDRTFKQLRLHMQRRHPEFKK